MKSSMNYLIPFLFFILGLTMGMNRFEPEYPITEVVLVAQTDTVRMSFSGCVDMIGGGV